MTTYVSDIDVIINGTLRAAVERGELKGTIFIHKTIIDFLQSEASKGRARGFTGIEELRRLTELTKKQNDVEIRVAEEDFRYLKDFSEDEVKRIVRDYAWKLGAVLLTSDHLQAATAIAMGGSALYLAKRTTDRLMFEKFFDSKTMSVHLKEGAPPLAKVGSPGRWVFVRLRETPVSRAELEEMAREILEEANKGRGFIEIDRAGSVIAQLGDYRIVITRPPLSNGWEITVVRPIAKLSLEDYSLPEKLVKRLLEKAEGILVAGAPGMGKTTFAQALAEFYARMGKIVKTIESPRDMRLPPLITQYSKTYAEVGELHDILLLSRPDYTVFDELRNDEDFRLYVDLRLAGIGMIGVVHATSPIDAIQRFLNRVELGMLPSIIDTVIFINEGKVAKVYELSMTVKLPSGLREAELTRPVVEVRDFITGELEYEIYTFGEQTMVVPVQSLGKAREAKVEAMIKKLVPEAEVVFRNDVVEVRLPRSRSSLTARKLKKLKKIADSAGFDLRIVSDSF
ncbi:MAG: PINc/VapC family ATPase [Acidilobaceae archaeon]